MYKLQHADMTLTLWENSGVECRHIDIRGSVALGDKSCDLQSLGHLWSLYSSPRRTGILERYLLKYTGS